ncbi:MAG TPA: bis(5'-nucleosyl)-tetraphosphatase (symmetrical) YqeK [Candidatus Cybelea sp.]|nr:bis(5'-nucleosyl)-tetraphosphatase (symmetrical) YqeK [Candidatus Cybelea sp.]
MSSYSQLARRVRAHLDQDHRYRHTVRVARYADVLAQHHGLDSGKARLAGMLHDLARLYSSERLLEECVQRGMTIDAFESANPIVLHARLGVELAREEFGVTDPEVLSAIEKHTVGAAQMSPLDCTLYLADGLEPAREFPERAALWELARRDLGAAMRGVILSSVRYVTGKGLRVAPQTVAAARTFGIELKETELSAN